MRRRGWSAVRGRWAAVRAVAARRPAGAGFVGGVATTAALVGLVAVVVPVLTAPGELEEGTLVILSGVDDGYDGQRQALINQWNALHPEQAAEIVEVTGGANAIRNQMVSDAQAGGRGVDIYNLDVTMMAEFVEFDYLRPLDESLVDLDGFLTNPLSTCWRDGELWALPFNTDAALLYYRTDLLGGREPPTTWAGIDSMAAELIAKPPPGVAPELRPEAGYTGQFADYEGLLVNAFEMIWEAGGDVVDDDGEVVIESTEARDGLIRLAKDLQGNPPVILPESLGFTERESTAAFGDGRVVFMRNWPVQYRELTAVGSDEDRIPFAVAPLPGRSVLGGQNLAIAAGSDQPRAAQELIEFLTNSRSQQILFERGGFAATREVVYQDEKVLAQYPYARTLLDAIRQADTRPDTPYYALFGEVFRDGLLEALHNGGELPADFSDRLADALRGVQRS
nr:extracellular solute-binding protein [Micromonospora sp. DSM 115978]